MQQRKVRWQTATQKFLLLHSFSPKLPGSNFFVSKNDWSKREFIFFHISRTLLRNGAKSVKQRNSIRWTFTTIKNTAQKTHVAPLTPEVFIGPTYGGVRCINLHASAHTLGVDKDPLVQVWTDLRWRSLRCQ